MKIYDCFMFFDEELILDIRLNVLNKFVDFFVIVESKYNHKGEKRALKFDIKKFSKFKDKIIYIVHENIPETIQLIKYTDSQKSIDSKNFYNATKRENSQRNAIMEGLKSSNDNDIILISDVDEIPNLDSLNLNKIKTKITVFEQDFFYYKFDLYLPNFIWYGTKAIKKKDLISPQWVRNIKCKKYSKFRIDILFSKTKYNDIQILKNGGWHFSNIKSPEEIEIKYRSYLHHHEFEKSSMNLKDIKNIVRDKKAIYDLSVDKREDKIGNGANLKNFDILKLPEYLINNKNKLNHWFDKN